APWPAQATTPARFGVVPAHGTVHTTWQVDVPSGTVFGSYSLKASASYHGAASGTATGTATVHVPYASLAVAADNTGVIDDAAPAVGAFASSGKTYSAQALAAAGVAFGPLTYNGTTFTWPSGSPDNVEASGQVVSVSGSGSTL